MKRTLYLIVALATLTLASCEKEPVGGTATQKMAGEWYVQVQGVDADGAVLYEDPDLFGIGNFWLLTYNTAANDKDSLFIQDVDAAFWDFRVKVGCDLDKGTFSIKGGENLQYAPCNVDITNGKILYGAARTPSGVPADSIVFDIAFDDDSYAGVYYDHLRVTGYRYTGMEADD